MFNNIFNNQAIKELAGILAEQEANRIAKELLKQADEKSKDIEKILEIKLRDVFI